MHKQAGYDPTVPKKLFHRNRELPRERMHWTCELMRDHLRLMEEQIDDLMSDLEELQLKEDDQDSGVTTCLKIPLCDQITMYIWCASLEIPSEISG